MSFGKIHRMSAWHRQNYVCWLYTQQAQRKYHTYKDTHTQNHETEKQNIFIFRL